VGVNLQSWHDLVRSIATIHLDDQPYTFRWALTSTGHFSVSSIYQAMIDSDIMPHNIFLWKIKIPLKVKVLLWLLYQKVILTKDNLLKRNWHGAQHVVFVTVVKQYNTFSYIVTLQNLFGEYCTLPLAYNHLLA
jgi:hypothetical protein